MASRSELRLEEVTSLLQSASAEERLAGVLLLSKLPNESDRLDASVHVKWVRPFLVQLLERKDGRTYAELAAAIVFASLPEVPLDDVTAAALLPWLHADVASATDERLEAVLGCLTHVVHAGLTVGPPVVHLAVAALRERSSAPSVAGQSIALLSALLRSGHVRPPEDEALVLAVVRLLCSAQKELRLEALSLLVLLLGAQSAASLTAVAGSLRLGLLDMLRDRATQPLWGVLRCVVEVSRRVGGVTWCVDGPSDSFLALAVGRVGVEVAMAMDGPSEDASLLMVALELLELVFAGLRDESLDEVSPLVMGRLVSLRSKLSEIVRVGLEFLVAPTTEGGGSRDVREGVAARLVASWAFLDPEAFRPAEVTALMPAAVAHLPWFLPALSEHWAADEGPRAAFVAAGGGARLLALVRDWAVAVAEATGSGREDAMEEWDGCRVNSFDSMISACSAVTTLCRGSVRMDETAAEPAAAALVEAAKRLLGRRDAPDCTTLLAFKVDALAHLLGTGAVKEAALRARAAAVVASCLPVAVANEALTTVRCVTEAIRGGDAVLRDAVVELKVLNMLRRDWPEPEQREAIKQLVSAVERPQKK